MYYSVCCYCSEENYFWRRIAVADPGGTHSTRPPYGAYSSISTYKFLKRRHVGSLCHLWGWRHLREILGPPLNSLTKWKDCCQIKRTVGNMYCNILLVPALSLDHDQLSLKFSGSTWTGDQLEAYNAWKKTKCAQIIRLQYYGRNGCVQKSRSNFFGNNRGN